MSYVLAIRRLAGTPLTRSEVAQVLADDEQFRAIGPDTWNWQPAAKGRALALSWEGEGALSTSGARPWTSDEGLAKLRQIANRLDASVIGEEGEDLSAPDSASSPSPWSVAGGLVVAVLSFPFLLLFLIFRLPWLVWKLLRAAR